ncbi:hypothetical protein JCM17845_17460 [Iodidimonas gelatinilytica]|uniref:Ribosomal RNA adenine methylase transferase N-terminal domain-containing protein n=1 Tax=Iodidimonas gelatinilytica TaxID=1236966 RepID=A0A5A7MYQ8_9PROT|nr:rRNA adenine dimethyltransferase family protein [Iodidimonas gelatinilytica]GER01123.1 hypothetical protein JCM17845_17460 [Iodidimonas gelatinilytica]
MIADDAMALDEKALFAGRPVKIVSNLPYNVGTALFVRWMTTDWQPWWQSLTLMFQREVAERIVAQPDSKAYGRLSVLSQWRADPRILFNVPASAFTPPPKVASAIIHVTPRAPRMEGIDPKSMERVTEAAFGQRRKMLRASLKTLTPKTEELLERAGITPTQRAETVNIDGFCKLALAWQAMNDKA